MSTRLWRSCYIQSSRENRSEVFRFSHTNVERDFFILVCRLTLTKAEFLHICSLGDYRQRA